MQSNANLDQHSGNVNKTRDFPAVMVGLYLAFPFFFFAF